MPAISRDGWCWLTRLIVSAAVCSLTGLLFGQETPAPKAVDSEHPRTTNASTRRALDPKLYWFYDGMKRLRDVETGPDKVKGVFLDRNIPFQFEVDRAALNDPVARTSGYKMASERIIQYLAPGKFSNDEDARRQLAELEASLRKMTGKDLHGYAAWKEWYSANEGKLHWSSEHKHLVVGQGVS